MKTLRVPQFDEFNNYKFLGYKNIKIKNKIDTAEYNKITSSLPGVPCGYCPAVYDITTNKQPIEVTRFYDIRQRGVKKLKNYFISII